MLHLQSLIQRKLPKSHFQNCENSSCPKYWNIRRPVVVLSCLPWGIFCWDWVLLSTCLLQGLSTVPYWCLQKRSGPCNTSSWHITLLLRMQILSKQARWCAQEVSLMPCRKICASCSSFLSQSSLQFLFVRHLCHLCRLIYSGMDFRSISWRGRASLVQTCLLAAWFHTSYWKRASVPKWSKLMFECKAKSWKKYFRRMLSMSWIWVKFTGHVSTCPVMCFLFWNA